MKLKRGKLKRGAAPGNTTIGGHDPYAALRYRDFQFLLVGRFVTSLGEQMVSFTIAWELWLRTHSELALGLVGLAQVIPIVVFSLPAGHIADHHNRKRIVMIAQVLLMACSLSLAFLSSIEGPLILIYLSLFGIGVARSFYTPATSTLLPQTVPPEIFTSAATWSSSAWQLAAIIGPAIAGVVVARLHIITEIYVFDALAGLTFLVLVTQIRGRELALSRTAATLDSLAEGLRFIRDTKVILAAITLDMFAVLFGGAVALLPVYATDILKVGSEGLGVMRAAPSIGALLMAITLAHLPPFQRAGRTLLLAVFGFGVATIIFGLSKTFWLSVVMLFSLGALDNISVVIRATLMLTYTPDEMRGRTSSVNSIFISASNELGYFESGATASIFGPVLAVVLGGIGTLIVVLSVATRWPAMRNLTTLDAPKPDAPETEAETLVVAMPGALPDITPGDR
ncbi:MAG TPA: MFS transporter [Aggregatilinea sp.]|uniref:MFS transporter n=1 Tax=Aggregatilinea sp. TaxID=2806333 RepID=UPI002D03DFAA|nr:MFS transporter [Aggregatilinea sp.]HML22984.1 MFS transporter [Aggregatilinea sp.]